MVRTTQQQTTKSSTSKSEVPSKENLQEKRQKFEASVSKAVEGRYFMKVDGKGGKLSVTGIPKRLTKNPSLLYVRGVRLTGTEEAVRQRLKSVGYTDTEVDRELKNLYSLESLSKGAVKESWDAEVKFHEGGLKEEVMSLSDISATAKRYLEAFKEDQTIGSPKYKKRMMKASRSLKSPKQGKKKDLEEKLRGLKDGKVYDVSNMTEGFGGIKPISRPVGVSRKVGIEGLNIVSSSRDNFEAVVRHLGRDVAADLAAYDEQLATLNPSPVKRKSPKKSATKSPKKKISAKVKSPEVKKSEVDTKAAKETKTSPKRVQPVSEKGTVKSPRQTAKVPAVKGLGVPRK